MKAVKKICLETNGWSNLQSTSGARSRGHGRILATHHEFANSGCSRFVPQDIACAYSTLPHSLSTARNSLKWVVFTARERVSAPQLSHTAAPYQHGSNQLPKPSSITFASWPRKAQLHLRSVSFSVTVTALPRSRSLLVCTYIQERRDQHTDTRLQVTRSSES